MIAIRPEIRNKEHSWPVTLRRFDDAEVSNRMFLMFANISRNYEMFLISFERL